MASRALAEWSNFYVMTGSSAAALTGLMFVVIGIVSQRLTRSTHDATSVFSTPTVTHFAAALLLSAVFCVPWHSAALPGTATAIAGIGGLSYVARLTFRSRRLGSYTADLEDWLFYFISPIVAYAAIAAGGAALALVSVNALYAIAAGVVILLFAGIHNAWDVVTFVASGKADRPESPGERTD
jgi:hypothetical protein